MFGTGLSPKQYLTALVSQKTNHTASNIVGRKHYKKLKTEGI